MYYFYWTDVKEAIKYLGDFRHIPTSLGDTEKIKLVRLDPGSKLSIVKIKSVS